MIASPTYSYISVAGYNLNFNISLGICSTSNCTSERATASSRAIDDSGSRINGNLSTSTSSINSNIFLPIGLALGALGLCTFGIIAGLRKYSEAP